MYFGLFCNTLASEDEELLNLSLFVSGHFAFGNSIITTDLMTYVSVI